MVNRFESNLLEIVYCIFGNRSFQQTLPLFLKPSRRPRCLSLETIELVKQALVKGTTQKLASDSGWRMGTFLRDGQVKTGRLWDRTDPKKLGLEFSKCSLDFLIWVTAADLSKQEFWKWSTSDSERLTLGDRFLFCAIMELLGSTDIGNRWSNKRPFFTNGLAVLMLTDRFAEENIAETEFHPWVVGQGGAVLEGLQSVLAKNWIEMEERKAQINEVEKMQNVGRAQALALERFMDAADAAGRRDLCRFLLVVFKRILENQNELRDWTGALDVSGIRVADRTVTYQAAAAVLLQANRLQRWQQESQTSGFLDENYVAMKLWKSDWERLNMQPLIDRAIRIGREASFL